MRELLQHPLSAAFPAMDQRDLNSLTADIQAKGLRHPIVIFDGQVIDGWHRYQACKACGLEPETIQLGEDVDPVAYVQSMNLHRRHLTGSQRASAVVACANWAPCHRPEKGEPGSPFQTNEAMAKAADVSEKTIKQAKRAHEAGLGDAVRDGKVTAKEAAQIAKLPEPERQAAIEAPKPEPKHEAKSACECEALMARIAELEDQNSELVELMGGLQEELEAARRALDAEDLLQQFDKEIKRAQEQARVTQARNNGLMNENSDLKGMLKSARRKIEKLEKTQKEAV